MEIYASVQSPFQKLILAIAVKTYAKADIKVFKDISFSYA